ncbi:DUF732 domain-containing protein [Mycobacterium avium]|uniref:DUF732 domain-containing protein n=1 Tax=Mycobacterium avium TaxID=1764 RepID=UPI0003D1FA5A|nr:DUF732 domain-containing protein [Mycobacterium avium]ETB37549.1 hypothetical protein O974_28210 [Mycobacterium avium 11-0986]MBZ4503722.1 DUF732 domain-containing protein [Mycobacterium avium subsp. hominissuis]MBZ4523262.1 DUF732 domain-containing protein [Mycobacterium avium subsp. hominissuis]MBZ4533124.1 DUF732 domain-containing protein [Mycobacterium avium subsp. hominissuis]MBZ4537811.1 DUF732 domain-containing protein [Mycobacterium avium subsp. hominissuis]
MTTIKSLFAIAVATVGFAATAWVDPAHAHADESAYLSVIHSRAVPAPDAATVSLGCQICADARNHLPKARTAETIDQQAQISDPIEPSFFHNAALINLCPAVPAGP